MTFLDYLFPHSVHNSHSCTLITQMLWSTDKNILMTAKKAVMKWDPIPAVQFETSKYSKHI